MIFGGAFEWAMVAVLAAAPARVRAPEPEPDAEAEPDAEPESDPESDPKSEPKTDPKSEPKTDPKSEPKTDPKSEPKTDPKSEPKTDPKSEPDAEGEPEGEPSPEGEPDAEAEPTPEPEPTPAPEPVGPPPLSSPDARRPVPKGAPSSGRDDDIVRRVLLGGGIASLTIGVGLAVPSIYWGSESVKADKAANRLDTPSEADARADAEARRDELRTRAIAVGAVAGAYTITGIVMLALTARDRRAKRQTVSPTASVDGFGIVWRGRF